MAMERYIDDMLVMQYTEHREQFLHHINNIDIALKFTVDDTRENDYLSFLDILDTPEHNGTLTPSIYSKPIHTDQYMHWDSHHHIRAKYIIIDTLMH